jgi:hypothetical protein
MRSVAVSTSVGLILLVVTAFPAEAAASDPTIGRRIDEHGPVRSFRVDDGGSALRGAAPAAARIVTVDDRRFTGAENAIYAPTGRTVFVAYLRHLRSPFDPGGDEVEAELRLARSVDGGRTWRIRVLDPHVVEPGDVIDQSVSIDGDGESVWIAYMTGPALKVARSRDLGERWAIRPVRRSGAGHYAAIDVVGPRAAVIAAERREGAAGPLLAYATTNAGKDWTASRVAEAGWYTGLGVAGDGRVWVAFYDPGATDLWVATAATPSGPWTPAPLAGQGEARYTGLGADLAVTPAGEAYATFEDGPFPDGRGTVRLARTTDGGATWPATEVDRAPVVGWNTGVVAIPTAGPTHVATSYWTLRTRPARQGRVRVATSDDGGATWLVTVLPEPGYVQPYLDVDAPRPGIRFVSYQVGDPGSPRSVLRVARIG